ncbi:MAG: imidazolonepropionase [Actinomycetota bacterium]|nr:imidazolonepropionase [Actinomycetota bacterium]
MTTTLLDHIGLLVTNDPDNPDGDGTPLGVVRDAAIVFDDVDIAWIGASTAAPDADEYRDLLGRTVIPGFVDAHSHLVFAADRADEFAARMAGKPYTAGGIGATVGSTREATDDELRANVQRLVAEMLAAGTTTVEIKGGYGLTVRDEMRSTRIAREFTDEVTYLGAHVVPAEYAERRAAYVDLAAGEMLDACAGHARWIDVFSDQGAFDIDETRFILEAGIRKGLLPRLHANQLTHTAAVRLGVELGAASVDHCNHLDDADLDALAGSSTVATVLPGADFSTRSPYADARRLLDAGVTVAIATDCNPGTSYTTNMPFCLAVAVRDMSLTPAQALWAATAGGAQALRRPDIGAIKVGNRADVAVLEAASYIHLAYRPGVPLVAETWRAGQLVFRALA